MTVVCSCSKYVVRVRTVSVSSALLSPTVTVEQSFCGETTLHSFTESYLSDIDNIVTFENTALLLIKIKRFKIKERRSG